MASRNRFLVVVRAGDESLHPRWTRDPDARDWDLVVSYYGNDPLRFRDCGDRRIDDKGQKWPALHALLAREDFWRGYDYVWLPDDDLDADQETISMLFRLAASFGLALVQPALSWRSHYSHPVTIRHPAFRARMTNFVEIMAPCFAGPFLEVCLPTFNENQSGWGLDWLWPRLLPDGRHACAILDELQVTHTRPVGGPGYDRQRAAGVDPWTERRELLRKYGIPLSIQACVEAAIERSGRVLNGGNGEDAVVLRRLLAADWEAFRATRRG